MAETMVLAGLAVSVVAAPGRSIHRSHAILAERLLTELATSRVVTLGEVVVALSPTANHLKRFRIIGDPLLPLASTPECLARASAISAPAPDDPLPPLGPDQWPGLDEAEGHLNPSNAPVSW